MEEVATLSQKHVIALPTLEGQLVVSDKGIIT